MSFTRNGAFSIDESRYLVDSVGRLCAGAAGRQQRRGDRDRAFVLAESAASADGGPPEGDHDPRSLRDLPQRQPIFRPTAAAYTATNPYKFDRYDPNSYNYSSATTVYDSAGNPQQATIYYTARPRRPRPIPPASGGARLLSAISREAPTATAGHHAARAA
jgi:flagellar hook protein FlgE